MKYFRQKKMFKELPAIKARKLRRRDIEIFLLVLVGIMLAFVIYKIQTEPVIVLPTSQSIKLKSPAELKQLVEQEKQNPLFYLNNYATIRSNLLGKKIIKGSIHNTASVAIYRNITLQVSFLTKTKDTLGNKNFILYETLKPGQSTIYKFKTDAPDSTTQYAVNIINAGSGN